MLASGVLITKKVIALGFNTLCYDAERRGIKPSARIKEADIGEDKKYIEPQICFSPNVEF